MGEQARLAREVGDRIRALRQERGWAQDRLAYEAGLHRAYLGGVERGERNPSLGSLSKIAKALAVPVRELFPEGR